MEIQSNRVSRILGVSAYYHDSAVALIEDGLVSFAAEEERFTRKKHDARFPHAALDACLAFRGLRLADLDFVAFYDKPFLKFERLLETYLAFAPAGFESFRTAIPVWLREKLFQRQLLKKELEKHGPMPKLLFAEHHQSHAASAFYPSPFEDAVVLTMDGVGEWATTSVAIGRGRKLETIREIHFPHSLGLLYSAFTYYTGFRVNSGEYKVMGLAPYGRPRYTELILEKLIDVKEDGSFRLDLRYFDFATGLRMTSQAFHDLFGGPPRSPEDPLDQRHMDLAASVQAAVERVILQLTRSLAAETGLTSLCLAGGVALNCVANGKILRDGRFSRIWIQPAAGDAGGALGAALSAYHHHLERDRVIASGDAMNGAYLGPEHDQAKIEADLARAGARFSTHTDEELTNLVVDDLIAEKAIGWFQGRMEFGPRALGARSILADPRSPKMQSTLNLRVKYRESFRPFAPAILREDLSEWFELEVDSPYMLLVAEVAKKRRREMSVEEQGWFGIQKLNVPRSEIPAVTHVDYSARIQTVHSETNPKLHALISRFKGKTGCPVLVNTSFNVRGEPIVATPEDAFRCLMGTEIETLAIGQCIVRKDNQDPSLRSSYRSTFEAD
ncbi:MAG: carbamoyltransferase [Deltaproteobacteria bacterium]|nr:carbamoyltransferase [Deltaproteobacteria bacterium]